jgi:Tol biopolymer transport system component/DNA-binding winged helix-turn-helix (wHTH) protein
LNLFSCDSRLLTISREESPDKFSENISDKSSDIVKDPQTKEFYEFGGLRLDVEKHRLWRGEELIALTPKEFELLRILVENAGRVLEKDELHERIWKDTFVEDGTLTRNVSWLRKKLEAGSDEKFIETYPKRGYRFLPEVTRRSADNQLVIEEQTRTRIQIQETISLTDGVPSEEPIRRLSDGKPGLAARRRVPVWLWLVFGVAVVVIGLGLYRNLSAGREAKVVLASHAVPFSGLPGRESLPAFSPDGKQIAFVWNGGEGELMDVYVRLIGAGEPVRLTKGDKDSLFPVFSPDSRYVAFSRSFPETSAIYLTPALGGSERKIAEVRSGGTSLSFSPDGKTIAVADKDSTSPTAGIFLVNVETGEKQRLTTPPEALFDQDPRFSPDGKSLAFLRAVKAADMDLYIVSADARTVPRRLTTDKTQIGGMAWSGDGQAIIFSSSRGLSSATNLWQVPVAGGEPVPMLTGGRNPKHPAVSADGKKISYVEEFEDVNIWKLDRSLAGGEGSDFKKFITSARSDHSQQISPDGSKIVFVSDRSGDSEIWLANADGSNVLQLTSSRGSGSPRFSPDGRFIAFGSPAEGRDDIFVISAEGGPPRQLTNGPANDILPAWSADGRFIYFTSNRSGDFQIWKIPAEGGEPTQITRHGAFETFASPDGKVLFYSKGRGILGLWRVGTDGGEEAPIAELAEAGYWRSWTMTLGGVYYVAPASSPPYQIKFYDFSDKRTKTVATTVKTPLWIFSGLSASTDGKWILYAQSDQRASNIVLAELGK